MKYSADTSMFIQAWRRYYPIDVFPSVWEMMDNLISEGEVVAIDEVRRELERKDDEAFAWVAERNYLFMPVSEPVQEAVKEVLRRYPRLLDTRRNRSGADPFVIALAMVEGLTVVTDERRTGSTNRPNIPDACAGLRVRCINILDMLKEEGGRF